MPAVGFGIVWFGYALTSWGYCMVKGYDVKFTDWLNPVHPYSGAWPPKKDIPASVVFPGNAARGTGGDTEGADPTAPIPNSAPKQATPPGTGTQVPSGAGAPVTLA